MSNGLRCCPKCSNPPSFVAPLWISAAMTSARRGTPHFCFVSMGCPHAAAIRPDIAPLSDAERAPVEARWLAETERLFAERTERWTAEEKSRFRRLLGYDPQADAGQTELPT